MKIQNNSSRNLKRIAANLYDLLIAIAIFMLSGFMISSIMLLILHQFSLITSIKELNENSTYRYIFNKILLLWSSSWVIYFYIWFWSKGQTVGMKAWRIILTDNKMNTISKKTALIRLCWSLFGVGNLFIFFNKNKLALQDYMTDTKLTIIK